MRECEAQNVAPLGHPLRLEEKDAGGMRRDKSFSLAPLFSYLPGDLQFREVGEIVLVLDRH